MWLKMVDHAETNEKQSSVKLKFVAILVTSQLFVCVWSNDIEYISR